jgi:hypothetical protein
MSCARLNACADISRHLNSGDRPHQKNKARKLSDVEPHRKSIMQVEGFHSPAVYQVIGDDRLSRQCHARDTALIKVRSGISIPAFG